MGRVDDKYLDLLRDRYRAACKRERTAILDEFVKTTGYHRKHATALLNGKRRHVKHTIRRPRRAVYTAELVPPLLMLVDLFDGICSKRLRAALNVELPKLYETGILQIGQELYDKLMTISPSSYLTL